MLNQFRSQKLTWNRANNQIYEKVYANEGDSNGRKLVVQIINDTTIEDLSGNMLSLAWRSKTNEGLDAFSEIDASEGLYEIYYTTEMLSNIGTIQASLVLITESERIESRTFQIQVEKSVVDDEAVQSDNSFTALTQALARVIEYQSDVDDAIEDIENQGSQMIEDERDRMNNLFSQIDDNEDTRQSNENIRNNNELARVEDELIRQANMEIVQGWIANPEQFDGRDLEFTWNGTSLGVRLEGDTEYLYVDLKGETGSIDNLDAINIEDALGFIPISADDVQDGLILGEGPIEEGWLFKPVIIVDERNE